LSSKNETHIVILKLPLEEYPALGKFQRLFELRIEDQATDETLRVLAEIGFPKLGSLVLPRCSPVTDRGMEYLLQIPSLESLGLTGRAVTDRSVDVFVRMPNLRSSGSTIAPA
jgi:hypothetical protein